MIRIKCSNPECSNTEKVFEWDESNDVKPGCGVSEVFRPGAETLLVSCPHCGFENKIWVVCPSGRKRGGGISLTDRVIIEGPDIKIRL